MFNRKSKRIDIIYIRLLKTNMCNKLCLIIVNRNILTVFFCKTPFTDDKVFTVRVVYWFPNIVFNYTIIQLYHRLFSKFLISAFLNITSRFWVIIFFTKFTCYFIGCISKVCSQNLLLACEVFSIVLFWLFLSNFF